MTEDIVSRDDGMYEALRAAWLREGKPGYIQYGGKNYRVLVTISESGKEALLFLPVDERSVYGSASF